MTTTTTNSSQPCDQSSRVGGAAVGESLTSRWFSESEIDQRVDAIVQQVLDLRKAESSRDGQQSLLFSGMVTAARPSDCRPSLRSLHEIVSQAFLAMIRGLPEDHVIIQSEANEEFINRCRLLGASTSEYELNKALLNVRKAGKLHRGIERGDACQLSRDQFDKIGYAAEMAARFVQMQAIEHGADYPTVDRILCDPSLRSLFDDAAMNLAPGFGVYEYRVAAFSYRKSGRESTIRLGETTPPDWDRQNIPLKSLDPQDAPSGGGVYRIDAGSNTLFVSATMNLRNRLLAHISAGDRRALLPPCLWDPPRGKIVVRWFEAPTGWRPRRADAVAQKMKIQEQAMYNLYASAG